MTNHDRDQHHDHFGEWVEPTGDKPAGYFVYKRSHSPYERWLEEEEIPIVRGIGVRDTRDVTLGTWKRRNARGAYLYLDGLEGVKGMYVLEVPSGGETNPEKHIYDEFFLVIEGRGTTEVWRGSDTKKQVFEWQAGTLFMIPVNANYRLVNATGSPALLLAANNAPGVFNIFQSHRFIFDNDWDFRERYDMTDDFFKPKSDLEMEPVRGRAAIRSNVFADIVNAELPLDNQRAPGYRRIQPTFSGFIQDACQHRRLHLPIPQRPVLQSPLPFVGRGAGVLARHGLHVQLARASGANAMAGRQSRRGARARVRAGRPGGGSTWRWELVPPALRHRPGSAAGDQLLGRAALALGHHRRRTW